LDNKGSQRRQPAFNTDQFESVYSTHINNLNDIWSASSKKYHRLMVDIYNAAS
jgi:hypothetical protein